ncbi:hypothetical protein BDB01DRAFT_616116 [Pilobolus umbonatus]|nr:hypothetical protein BDB01DRAFT_616116 [Pilobolus umbonatus]
MESLPIELVDIIFQYVPTDSYLNCSMVCSQWNNLISKYLYSTIDMYSERKIKLLLEAMTLYPRCMKAGRHIKTLQMCSLTTVSPFKIHSSVKIDFIDAMVHCPNIKELVVDGFPTMILSFLDPRMPALNKLEYLHFMDVDDEIPDRVMDCYYKFRSSLKYLDLTLLTKCLGNYTLEDILSYISAFTRVDKLKIKLPFSLEMNRLSTFNAILDKCPRLSHILYKGSSLNVPHYNIQPPLKQSSISNVELDLTYASLNDIYYIKDKFKCLNHLSLNINNKLMNEPEVIGELMSINCLTNFDIELRNSYSKDTLSAFWKHSGLSTYPHINSSKTVFGSSECLKLSFTSSSGVRSMSSELTLSSDIIEELGLKHEDYLEAYGSYLHKLDISFFKKSHISLNTLNILCPKLIELTIRYANLPIYNEPITSNHNLKELTLGYCIFPAERANTNQPFFRDIDLAFPNLNGLYLACPDFDDRNLDNMIYKVQLPTNLRQFTLVKTFIMISPWRAVAVKEIDGVHKVSWYFNDQTLSIFTENEDVVQEYFERIHHPLFVFESQTLDTAELYVGDHYISY